MLPDDAQMEDYKHRMVKRVENEQWYHMLLISRLEFLLLHQSAWNQNTTDRMFLSILYWSEWKIKKTRKFRVEEQQQQQQ